MTQQCSLKKIDDWRWLIPKHSGMRTDGLIFASEKMVPHICGDKAHSQVENVAYLPGIVGKSLAMPDIHWGYGFPIGGVAAFDMDKGVISPGGIGYDINCGVRLLRTNLRRKDVSGRIKEIVQELFRAVPSGVGSTGKISLSSEEVKDVLKDGAVWAVKKGFGRQADLKHTEENGRLDGAVPESVGQKAIRRGHEQLGTLGAGNHFLEIQFVEEIYDAHTAAVFGLASDFITIMIHTGSRGLGYQVCDDSIRVLQSAVQKYSISLPDRQLVCAPVGSPEGRTYFSAMASAANYAWANRQIITHWVREVLVRVMSKTEADMGLEVVYDVAHNIGKFEEHMVGGTCREDNGRRYSHNIGKIEEHSIGGKKQKLMVHRKGATRAFPSGHPDIPQDYRSVGQPVLVPGTMGTSSYVLVGMPNAMDETWGSTCHGAGRLMSRTQSLRNIRGEELARQLEQGGIFVKSDSWKTLAEEAPNAYKDVNQVVEVCHRAGISKKVAKLKPLGLIKG